MAAWPDLDWSTAIQSKKARTRLVFSRVNAAVETLRDPRCDLGAIDLVQDIRGDPIPAQPLDRRRKQPHRAGLLSVATAAQQFRALARMIACFGLGLGGRTFVPPFPKHTADRIGTGEIDDREDRKERVPRLSTRGVLHQGLPQRRLFTHDAAARILQAPFRILEGLSDFPFLHLSGFPDFLRLPPAPPIK